MHSMTVRRGIVVLLAMASLSCARGEDTRIKELQARIDKLEGERSASAPAAKQEPHQLVIPATSNAPRQVEAPKSPERGVAPSAPAMLESREFSGRGQQATSPVMFEAGLYVFRMTHSGQGHFGIRLLQESGRGVESLVSTTGPFDGSKAVKIPASASYILDVMADGDWTVHAGAPGSGAVRESQSFDVSSNGEWTASPTPIIRN